MGDIADFIEVQCWTDHDPAAIPEGLWLDRFGQEHQISEMDTAHLTNAIRFAPTPEKADELRAEIARRATTST